MEQTEHQDAGHTAKHHAGAEQILRIDELQRRINYCSHDPLLVNENSNTYNYIVWLNSLYILYKETRTKINSDLFKEGEKLIIGLRRFIEKNPVHKEIFNEIRNRMEVKFYVLRWNILRGALDGYDLFVRRCLEDAGLDNPNKGEEEGL